MWRRATAHSTQHTAHSTQHTAHSTQHAARSTPHHTQSQHTVAAHHSTQSPTGVDNGMNGGYQGWADEDGRSGRFECQRETPEGEKGGSGPYVGAVDAVANARKGQATAGHEQRKRGKGKVPETSMCGGVGKENVLEKGEKEGGKVGPGGLEHQPKHQSKHRGPAVCVRV